MERILYKGELLWDHLHYEFTIQLYHEFRKFYRILNKYMINYQYRTPLRFETMAVDEIIQLEGLLDRKDLPNDIKGIIRDSISKMEQYEKEHQAIQESEKRYRMLFEEAPIPLMEIDLSEIIGYLEKLDVHNIQDFDELLENNPQIMRKVANKLELIRINESSLKFWQINSKDEWLLAKIGDPELGHPYFRQILRSILYKRESFESEVVAYTVRQRKKIHALVKASFLPDPKKSPEVSLVSFIDVTELRERERSFRSLFEDAPFPLMEFDLSEIKKYVEKFKIQSVQNFERFIGENPEELKKLIRMAKLVNMNEAALNLYDINDKSEFRIQNLDIFFEGMATFLSGELKYESEAFIATTSKGENVNSLYKASVVPGHEELLSKVFLSIVDITKLKKAEQEIRQSEVKIRNIINYSKDGIILVNEKGNIIEWNPAMVQLTEINAKDALYKPFWSVYRPLLPGHLKSSKAVNLILSRLEDVLATGEAPWLARPIESELLVKGKYNYVQLNIFPIKTRKGFMLGSIWRDITHVKQSEEKMRKELLKFKIEERNIYLAKEAEPIFAREVLRDLIKLGYFGLICSRITEKEYRGILEEDFQFIWLAETTLKEKEASIFKMLESKLEMLPPKSVVLIDGVNFLIVKYGFQETLNFVFKVRELAILLGFVVILSVDEEIIPSNQLRLLEKETREIETRVLAKIPADLLEILQYVYKNNNLGKRPSYTDIVNDLMISRPTIRKRTNQLLATGYLRETQIGRRKTLEITQKGFNLFSVKDSDSIR